LALLHRGFRICLDAGARRFEKIHLSAGVRGVDIEIGVEDLVKVTDAKVVEATE
jgi:prolyl-tRNA editing enzyme YbaK/EbsC (Cys-tRNA(Pro) deacylase)